MRIVKQCSMCSTQRSNGIFTTVSSDAMGIFPTFLFGSRIELSSPARRILGAIGAAFALNVCVHCALCNMHVAGNLDFHCFCNVAKCAQVSLYFSPQLSFSCKWQRFFSLPFMHYALCRMVLVDIRLTNDSHIPYLSKSVWVSEREGKQFQHTTTWKSTPAHSKTRMSAHSNVNRIRHREEKKRRKFFSRIFVHCILIDCEHWNQSFREPHPDP